MAIKKKLDERVLVKEKPIFSKEEGEGLGIDSKEVVLQKKEKHIASGVSFIDNIHEPNRDEEYLEYLASIVEFSDDAIISRAFDGTITSWNKASEKMFGYSAKQAVGKSISIIIPPEYISQEKDLGERILNDEIVGHFETVRNKKGGSQFYVSITLSPLKDKAGNIIAISKIARDITAQKKAETAYIEVNKELVFQNEEKEKRAIELGISNLSLKRAEEKVVKANRLYSFISHIRKALSHVKDEQTLFNEACKIAIEQGKFRMAWIGIIDAPHRRIRLVASSGSIESDSRILANKAYDIDGPTEKVLQGANYCTVNDIQEEQKISWRKYARKRGFNSSICLPIRKEGKVIGTFDMYSTETDFFDIEEIKMLEEIAGDITFGLEVFEKDRKNREAEELAIQIERRFRALIENSSDMNSLSNKEGQILYSSPSIEKILGYTPEELLFKNPQNVIHPEELPSYLENRNMILQTPGKSFHFEQRRRHKNGEWIWCEGILSNMLDVPTVNAVVSNFRDISERKAAELAQLESKNLIESIYTASLDAVIIIDDEGKITKWDIKAESLFGWNEQEVLGVKLSETIVPERYRKMHDKGMKHYLKTGESVILGKTIDISAIKKNGIEFAVSLSITPSQVKGKTHFIGFVRDISERNAAEQQNEFDKNNMNALINNTKDLMWSIDTNFKLITCNNSFSQVVEQMTGKVIEKGSNVLASGFTVEQIARFRTLYERAFAGEAFTEIEHTATPYEFWREISYYPIINGKEVIGTACYSHDITDIKKAEQQLQKSEAFNRGVIGSLSSHIAVIDTTGVIIAVNEAWKSFALENGETTLNRTGEGSNYFETCNKSVKAGDTIAAEALQGIKDVMGEGIVSFYLEYPCHSPIEQRWFAMRVMKFESDNQMVVVAHENITERIKAEKERDHTQEANEELIKTRNELNIALAKEKDLNELKSRFVAVASHEFRTPLTTMMSSLSLVAKYNELNDKENQLKHVGKIKTSIENLTGILNDFLSLSKLEEGKIEAKPRAINLKIFITDIITEMRLMAEDGQKIVLNYSGSKIGLVDGKILKNILHNLISNALKFSPKNGLVEVNVKSLKSSIKIFVKDNGIGIPKKDQKHLFERFFRGQNAIYIQGTGLGLNIVTKYVEQLNGSISFESKENKGTTFKILIPQ